MRNQIARKSGAKGENFEFGLHRKPTSNCIRLHNRHIGMSYPDNLHGQGAQFFSDYRSPPRKGTQPDVREIDPHRTYDVRTYVGILGHPASSTNRLKPPLTSFWFLRPGSAKWYHKHQVHTAYPAWYHVSGLPPPPHFLRPLSPGQWTVDIQRSSLSTTRLPPSKHVIRALFHYVKVLIWTRTNLCFQGQQKNAPLTPRRQSGAHPSRRGIHAF